MTNLSDYFPSAIAGKKAIIDKFTDSNGTAITAHVPDFTSVDASWLLVTYEGTAAVTIESNKMKATHSEATPTYPAAYSMIDAGFIDGTIEVEWYASNESSNTRLMIRGNSDGTGYTSFSLIASSNTISLIDGGDLSTLDTDTYTLNIANTYTLKMVFSGATINCYINGSLVLSTTGASVDSDKTHIGINNRFQNDTWDNLICYEE